MLFSESASSWQAVPAWAQFLINFGYCWDQRDRRRRIAIVSMPCDSAAAGLIALGAIRRRLELSCANDLAAHYERFKALSTTSGEQPAVRHRHRPGRFRFDSMDSEGNPWLRHDTKDDYRMVVLPANATDWQFDGEAPVMAAEDAEIPYELFYRALIEGVNSIHAHNLRTTDSVLCLAGRSAGESVTRRALDEVNFQLSGEIASLSSLLSVQAWLSGRASRLTFYNVRTGNRDREVGTPMILMADGHTSFLDVVDQPDFHNSDIISVISRTVEREELERVGAKIASFEQWYVPEPYAPCADRGQLPRGMELLLLVRQ
jgi:hypothetical protein